MTEYFRLNNGILIPAVGYGSYKATDIEGKRVIADALKAGYRYIDTASFYRNEAEIGEAIKEACIAREDLFLVSKVWPTMLGTEETLKSFEESRRNLHTDYLDMLLIHWPSVKGGDKEWFKKCLEGWRVMEQLVKEGRVRAIGLSNFLPHHIRPLLEECEIRPVVDQLELHVGYMQEYTLSYLEGENILPQAWSPMGRGRVLNDERVLALSEKYHKSPAQILLKFLIQRGISVIPKASSMERMLENKDLFDFELSFDEISVLSCVPETGWSGEHPDMIDFSDRF